MKLHWMENFIWIPKQKQNPGYALAATSVSRVIAILEDCFFGCIYTDVHFGLNLGLHVAELSQ